MEEFVSNVDAPLEPIVSLPLVETVSPLEGHEPTPEPQEPEGFAAPELPPPLDGPLPVRKRERKPQRRAASEPSTSPDETERRGKRSRKAPEWMRQGHGFNFEGAPKPLAEALQDTKAPAHTGKSNKGEITRVSNVRMMGYKTVLVEMNYRGKKYHGLLDILGPSSMAGQVLEEPPDQLQADQSLMLKNMCSLCNRPIKECIPGVEEEMNKVARVAVSSNRLAQVHLACALWCPEVFEDNDGNLINLNNAVRRARSLKCCVCKDRGASVSCSWRGCQRDLHVPCALETQCHMNDQAFLLLCPQHSKIVLRHPSFGGDSAEIEAGLGS